MDPQHWGQTPIFQSVARFLLSCEKCGRDGCYGLHRLIEKRGRDGKVIDWLGELTAECPKKIAHNMNDPCGARFPDLPRVL